MLDLGPEQRMTFHMNTRRLGRNGPSVSSIVLGCMGMSAFDSRREDSESIAAIHRAFDLGGTLIDTSDAYGPHTNEVLVGRVIAGKRDQVFPRHQVRLCPKSFQTRSDNRRWQPRLYQESHSRESTASWRRNDRPLLSTPRRSQHSH
jgi:aryl-alcohol dehydrogenase-like predicted oxidoreductase